MAQKVVVQLVDDIDATEATETIHFAVDGVSYEIDLSDANASSLRESVAPWIAAARRVGGRSTRAGKATASTARPSRSSDTAAIRQWARDNGKPISERGRISADVREAYAAAH